MAPMTKGNYNALMWLQDDLQTALEQALAAMNKYIDEQQDPTLLTDCTEALVQVKGSLDMVNIAGASLLTEEMQHTLIALRKQADDQKQSTQDVLIRSLLLLPNYLKLLSHDFEDHPISLLENINELRAARDVAPLSPSELFEPDLSIALPDSIAPNPKRKQPQISVAPNKLGQVYQVVLLAWLKQNDVDSIRKLLGIVRYLRTISEQDITTLFWWCAEGMLEALAQDGITASPEAKQLVGKLAPHVKTHSEQGEMLLMQNIPSELRKQLLLQVAMATSHGPQVTLLKITLGLHFYDHRQKIYGMSDNALGDAHLALLEQIDALKPSIDEYAEMSKPDPQIIEGIIQQLLSMADTLTLLTEYESSNLVHHQADHLQAQVDNQGGPTQEDLTELADSLLQVEQLLQSSSQDSRHDQLRDSVMSETLLEMTSIKETLTLMSQGKRDQSALEDTLQQLRLIAGSLGMMNFPEATAVINRTHDKIATQLEGITPFTQAQLTGLAEILAACDLYMENVQQHGMATQDYLAAAESKLAAFDGLVDGPALSDAEKVVPTPTISSDEPSVSVEEDFSIDVESSQEVAPPISTDDNVEEDAAEFALSDASTLENTFEEDFSVNVETSEPVDTPISIDSPAPAMESTIELTSSEDPINSPELLTTTESLSIDPSSPTPELIDSVMPVESPVSADMAGIESMNMPDMADWQFADGVDPEIAEVFIEEANEVLGELDQLIPLWLAGDQTALQDIRRHFHTLKGSGRMAGATVIGELAWAVEDILNRVIENSIVTSENVEMLTAEAHQLMTPLLIQFVKADMRQTEQVDALHALKAACLSPTPAVDTPTSLPDNNLIVEPEVVELENDIEPLSLDASTFNDLDDTNEALEAFAEEQHDVTPDELLTSEETQEESYTQPEEWVVDLTLDDSTVEETTIEAFESESPAPFSLDTEVLTSVEYYIRQKAEKETAIPVEQAPEVLELSEADLAEFEFDPNDMPGSIESDEAPISFEAELPVSEPEPEPVIIPAVETRPFTGVERYLVAKQRAEQGQTSVEAYLSRQTSPIELDETEEVITAPKEVKPFTSVDRYLVAQQRSIYGPSSVDNYLDRAANSEPLESEPVASAETAVRPLTSVERYELAQVRAEHGPTTVDDYIAKQSTTVDDEMHLPELTVSESPAAISDESSIEDELLAIFCQEAEEHIATIKASLDDIQFSRQISKVMMRAVHSLKGCANIADVQTIAQPATALDAVMKQLHAQDTVLDSEQMTLLAHIADDLSETLTLIFEDQLTPDIDALMAVINSLMPESAITEEEPKLIDPEFLAVFLEETDELLEAYTNQLAQWLLQPWDDQNLTDLVGTLYELEQVANQAGQPAIAQLYVAFKQLVQLQEPNVSEVNALLETGFEQLNRHIEGVLENKALAADSDYLNNVAAYIAEQSPPDIEEITPTAPTVIEPTPSFSETMAHQIDEVEFPLPTDVDAELLEAFSEEAAELLNSSGQSIKAWQNDLTNEVDSLQLQRDLHTLKGGARLTGLMPMADLTHQIETLVLEVCDEKHPADEDFFDLLQRCQDKLCEMQEQLADQQALSTALSLIHEVELLTGGEDLHIENRAIPEPEKVVVQTPKEVVPLPEAKPQAATKPATPVEQVRVRADLLDYLSNFAGEVSISSDRITQVHTGLHQQLREMEDTVGRLNDQLRKLEIETETQILFRYEDDKLKQDSEFDPLELDRFSTIQQLSRSLTESMTDLGDITRTMDTLMKDMDGILLQQSRLNNDLQEGLMGTRLLPFSAVTPRLERIVRQTANELDKKAMITVIGDELEIDRTILDRLVAPLEHILRNAIAHGIENPSERNMQYKPEQGQLRLTIQREGSEMVLTMEDDGRGINVEKIKEKALALGLIQPYAIPSEDELIQFILSSGFSTADSVSQVAGRGVGMDVVHNEIRSLKGRLAIATEAGKGTTFTIRLPLTLSVILALLVKVNDESYAIPLNSVYAGERITVRDVKLMLGTHQPQYTYNGEHYDFMPLSVLLDKPLNLSANLKQQMPLLLFRSGDLRVALLVDQVFSNREIVIKSVGPQLGQISAITGATILGDGQVVFIIDIPTLMDIHGDTNLADHESHVLARELAEFEQKSLVAMVVDDSITMRKASGNLLKRLGFEVMTARDGVDALSQLQEQKPDVILLDVEMPRMDGFEFASIVRNDAQLRHLPIIMITSRTGQKHRDRAREIGVNEYLGKPYQEDELTVILEKLLSIQLGEQS